jgi:hypothetical protein
MDVVMFWGEWQKHTMFTTQERDTVVIWTESKIVS